MAIYVNRHNGLDISEPLLRECPHCGKHAQLLPVAHPKFELLAQTRPKHAGLVFRCAACNEPRFLRAAVRAIGSDRIELASHPAEVEHVRERFPYGYLPDTIEQLVREALDTYSLGAHNAFATMARRATRTALRTMDAGVKQRWHESLLEMLQACGVDEVTTGTVETVLFAPEDELPLVTPDEAAVLVEALKDLFYQSYVRTAKVRAAMKMRRFFAGEGTGKVTAIDRDGWRELA